MLKTRTQGAIIAFIAFLGAPPAVMARDAGFPIAPSVIVNGKTVAHALTIEDGTTYVPLRAVTEALGAGVKFDRAKQQIILSPQKSKTLSSSLAPAPNEASAAPAVPATPVPAEVPTPLSTPRQALKGIGAIFVAATQIAANADTTALLQQQSMTDAQLRAGTTAQLQAAGVPVTDTPPSAPGGPELLTDITTVHSPSRLLTSYYIHISIREGTHLQRDDSVAENSITWQTGTIGYASDANIDSLRDSVKDRVADFIADYLAANPRQQVGETQPSAMSQAHG